jgi:hypothetical protein
VRYRDRWAGKVAVATQSVKLGDRNAVAKTPRVGRNRLDLDQQLVSAGVDDAVVRQLDWALRILVVDLALVLLDQELEGAQSHEHGTKHRLGAQTVQAARVLKRGACATGQPADQFVDAVGLTRILLGGCGQV